MRKIDKLTVAAGVAPTLRSEAEKDTKRRVTVYDQNTGEVVGYTTLAEVKRGALKTANIELAVVEGRRPDRKLCVVCGLLFRPRTGCPVAKLCTDCRNPCCADCGARLGKSSNSPSKIRLRHGRPARCYRCAKLVLGEARLREMGRRGAEAVHSRSKKSAARTRRRQSESLKKTLAGLTKEERRARVKAAVDARLMKSRAKKARAE